MAYSYDSMAYRVEACVPLRIICSLVSQMIPKLSFDPLENFVRY